MDIRKDMSPEKFREIERISSQAAALPVHQPPAFCIFHADVAIDPFQLSIDVSQELGIAALLNTGYAAER